MYQFDSVFGGAAPASSNRPWIDGCFRTLSPGTVQLTVSNLTLTGSESVDQLYFNLNPGLNPTRLAFSFSGGSGGFDAPTVSTGVNQFKAGGDGKYDILFLFSQGGSAANRFTAGEYLNCQISGIPTLTAADFGYLSMPVGGAGPFYAAAHVQRISHSLSGWLDPSGMTPMPSVPEPPSALLFAVGVAGWLVARGRWRRS